MLSWWLLPREDAVPWRDVCMCGAGNEDDWWQEILSRTTGTNAWTILQPQNRLLSSSNMYDIICLSVTKNLHSGKIYLQNWQRRDEKRNGHVYFTPPPPIKPSKGYANGIYPNGQVKYENLDVLTVASTMRVAWNKRTHRLYYNFFRSCWVKVNSQLTPRANTIFGSQLPPRAWILRVITFNYLHSDRIHNKEGLLHKWTV